ncbi:MAG: methyl-accepting chemotaxis protein [Gemmatimonadaceae bacterium]|nr:methyl-accepting chemotaxis protein [Gemmatimonadaceae bacterium]
MDASPRSAAAGRFRSPAFSPQALREEQRAKDAATFRVAARRRFWSTLLISGALLLAMRLGLAAVSLTVVGVMVALALAVNQLLAVVGRTPSLYRPWLKYLVAIVDTALVSLVVFVFGSPVLVLAYVLVIVPYSFDQGTTLGYVTSLASVVGFFTASWWYGQLHAADAAPWPQVLLAGGLLLVVAQQVIQMPSKLIARLRRTRERMARIERGDLTARADARHDDELGFLERSFNRMLDELVLLIETVQEEAESLAAVATQVSATAHVLQRRAGEVTGSAESLREALGQQREKASVGVHSSREARHTAELARRTAEATASDAKALDDAAVASRAAIDRAAQALLRVGAEVTAAAQPVRALAPASEQVGDFIATVTRIARQTNLLALNAAMEASRAGEDGVGFAVVAEEIRVLATESARAAQVVAATVQRVRGDITTAVQAMDATANEVQGAGAIARDATRALSAMVDGIGRVSRQSDEVSTLAQAQARLSASVATAFEGLDGTAQRANAGARAAADAAGAQRASIEELSRSAQQLTAAASRLRAVALRHTAEYAVVAPPSSPPVATAPPMLTDATRDQWPVDPEPSPYAPKASAA